MRRVTKKVRKGCDRCVGLEREGAETTPARYRALIDRFLCEPCYPRALEELRTATGLRLPAPNKELSHGRS